MQARCRSESAAEPADEGAEGSRGGVREAHVGRRAGIDLYSRGGRRAAGGGGTARRQAQGGDTTDRRRAGRDCRATRRPSIATRPPPPRATTRPPRMRPCIVAATSPTRIYRLSTF
ncbi:hypothetical protein EVAR_62225_1 [Eumeta japonica]|uniref:Uncharacterized protein n=1 Tax=Eumeta variegata TaxID=151549 RepID=A0A4C1ZG32_EUMVA|nr:hypothetical protein EVAR_62225_1 [Eumeta japonica]